MFAGQGKIGKKSENTLVTVVRCTAVFKDGGDGMVWFLAFC